MPPGGIHRIRPSAESEQFIKIVGRGTDQVLGIVQAIGRIVLLGQIIRDGRKRRIEYVCQMSSVIAIGRAHSEYEILHVVREAGVTRISRGLDDPYIRMRNGGRSRASIHRIWKDI